MARAADVPVILAVDPGSSKLGVAVVVGGGIIREQRVEAFEAFPEAIRDLIARHPVTHVVIGDRTGAEATAIVLRPLIGRRPLFAVDEHLSSQEARGRYFRDHPPRGLRRLIPLGLQVPPCPVDDYVAVILAERYLAGAPAVPLGEGPSRRSGRQRS